MSLLQANPEVIKRLSLTDQTVAAIRSAILLGQYKLGQKLREADLVARYGVSNSVIREALHTLQGEGIVVTKPYCGRSVFDLSEAEATDLMVMRTSLESYAAWLAAEKLNENSKARILQATQRMKSGRPLDYAEWVDRELFFHSTIWEVAGNDWIRRQLAQFAIPLFAMGTLEKFHLDFDVKDIWGASVKWERANNPRGHQVLAQAILSGDRARAREAMILHIMPESVQPELRRQLFHV